jgi:LuxR family maltose regulon positive regulatory protein
VPGDVISRPRLLALLDQNAPLTVLRGACGAGKTVLLSEWVQSTDSSVVWITAAAEQADSQALARAIVRRVRRGVIDSGQSTDGWRAVREALNESDQPVTIVLDDAAMVSREALIALCETIAAVPTLRVVAAANRASVLDSDGIALLVDRLVITPLDLMFDAEEIGRALHVDAEMAQRALVVTSGFPALVHAMARRGLPAATESLLDSSVEAVEEYMRMRVSRAGYDPALIATLVRTSFADELDAALAQALSGDEHVSRVLDEAEHYGFGSWSADRSGPVFRYAPFARALLRRELERAYAAELPGMRRAVVEWMLGRGRPDAALRIAVEDHDDLSLARHVVISSWYQLLNHGHAVRAILGAIPLSVLKQEPLLVMLLAICYNAVRVRRIRGLQLFRIAISAANSRDPELSAVDRLFIWVAESAALRILGMHDRAAGVATKALKLLADTPEEEKEGYADQLPLLCAQLGQSLYYGGLERQAIECFAFGAALAAAGENEHGISNLAMLSGIHALNGDIPEARHYVEVIRRGKWSRRYLDGYQGTFYRVAEAIIALEEGDASRAAQQVAAFEPHRATSEHWVVMATVEAVVALSRGHAAMAVAQLESLVQLRGREGTVGSARRALSGVRALLQLALGNCSAAAAILQKDAPQDRFETSVARARIALIENRPRDTLRALSAGLAASAPPRARAMSGALRVAALIRTGGVATARAEARALGALLCDRELRWPLALLPAADARAVGDLLRDEAPRPVEAPRSVLPDSGSASPLTDRELVVLRALGSGKPLVTIAAELGVSLNTIKTQAKSVYRKLGVAGREEAVAAAVGRGLLSGDG